MSNQVIPTKQGQIVKSLITLPGLDHDEQFLLADDPQYFKHDDLVGVYSITEFLRCQARGEKPFENKIQLKSLTVIGESLQEWVESWNK